MKKKNSVLSLRVRLVLLVAAELVVSILVALWVRYLLEKLLPEAVDIPLMLYLIVASLCVGILVTAFLSRLFFSPIKKLREAMSKVAEGDFTIKLHTNSNSREIEEIYSGFNLMTDELRSTEVLQTDFVSNVSHEFKTPWVHWTRFPILAMRCCCTTCGAIC